MNDEAATYAHSCFPPPDFNKLRIHYINCPMHTICFNMALHLSSPKKAISPEYCVASCDGMLFVCHAIANNPDNLIRFAEYIHSGFMNDPSTSYVEEC